MMKSRYLQPSLGAMVGVIVGACGGLFALDIAPAILTRDVSAFRATPTLSIISWLVSGIVGWVLGGQLGLHFRKQINHRNAEVAAGVLGGLIPVVLIALWGWHMFAPR